MDRHRGHGRNAKPKVALDLKKIFVKYGLTIEGERSNNLEGAIVPLGLHGLKSIVLYLRPLLGNFLSLSFEHVE